MTSRRVCRTNPHLDAVTLTPEANRTLQAPQAPLTARSAKLAASIGRDMRGVPPKGKSKLTALELRIFMKALLLPPGGPLLIGVAGLLIWTRRPRLGLALCTVSIVSLWLLAMPIVSDALTRATEGYPALDPTHLTETQARAQAIVILGGGVRRGAPEVGGDAPSTYADLRLIEGRSPSFNPSMLKSDRR